MFSFLLATLVFFAVTAEGAERGTIPIKACKTTDSIRVCGKLGKIKDPDEICMLNEDLISWYCEPNMNYRLMYLMTLKRDGS